MASRIFHKVNRFLPLRYRGNSEERYWEATFLFAAADEDEANKLYDAMHEGLGCIGDGDDHKCPHFRLSSMRELETE